MWSSNGYSAIPTSESCGNQGGHGERREYRTKYGSLLLALVAGCLLGIAMGSYLASPSDVATPAGTNEAMLVGIPAAPGTSDNSPYGQLCNPADDPSSLYALGEMDIATSLEMNPSAEVLKQIHKAEREILMCVYKLSDQEIIDSLLTALRRGVQVNIIADKGAQLEGKGKECLGRLAAAGAHVRIWGKHRGYNKLHAKFSVFDNKLGLAGSNNGSKGAGRHNLELLLRFDMEPAVRQLRKKFIELFNLGHRLHVK